MDKPLQVFGCYARKDQSYLFLLKKHLKPLEHRGLLTFQADIDVSPGEEWEKKIGHYLNTAQIILFLISADFMASDYCYSKEMRQAIERHEVGQARVIPIILRPVDWNKAPFGKLQVLPANARPITAWRNRDEALLDIVQGIRKVVEELRSEFPEGLLFSASVNTSGSAGLSGERLPQHSSASKITLPPPSHHPRVSILRIGGGLVFVSFLLALLFSVFVLPKINIASNASSCPTPGTARPVVLKQQAWGHSPNIIYQTKIQADSNSSTDILPHYNVRLQRYDVRTGKTTEILRIPNTDINDEQISKDGQWLLFTNGGRTELQIVRMDGQFLQTLYCSASAGLVSPKWSDDQRSIIFGDLSGRETLYLLDINTGILHPEIVAPAATLYSPIAWLDANRIYMTVSIMAAPICGFGNLGILDTRKGTNQNDNNLQLVTTLLPGSDADKSLDGKYIYYSNNIPKDCLDFNNVKSLCGPNACANDISVLSTEGEKPETISSVSASEIRVVSSTTLLLLIEHNSNTNQNGLWKMSTDGSHLTRLTIDNNGMQSLNELSDNPWSNVSRDSKMYALSAQNQDASSELFFGSMNGDSLTTTTFASEPRGMDLAVIGWTTI